MSVTIAQERIALLFEKAHAYVGKDDDLVRDYLARARRIAEDQTVSFTKEQRMRFCDACRMLLVPGRSARVRLSGENIVITCDRCGSVSRFGYND